jgi:hypothetical protein
MWCYLYAVALPSELRLLLECLGYLCKHTVILPLAYSRSIHEVNITQFLHASLQVAPLLGFAANSCNWRGAEMYLTPLYI